MKSPLKLRSLAFGSVMAGMLSITQSPPLLAADVLATAPASTLPAATQPIAFPGKGLAQHPFLLTGEWDHRKKVQTIFLIQNGKIIWTYDIPMNDATGTMEELGDATMRANGNIVFCRKVGASEVTPDKKIIWNVEAPKGAEIHSVQPLGLDHVLLVINGNPAKLLLINTATGVTEKETALPTAHPDKSHLQFRRVRQTQAGTILAAQLDNNKVAEYNPEGKEIWSVAAPSP